MGIKTMNKKIRIFIILLSVTCLFSIMQGSESPIMFVYLNMFLSFIANYHIGLLLMIVCFIIYKKYNDELTSRDISTVTIISLLLFVCTFLFQNPSFHLQFSQIKGSMDWTYLLGIFIISLYFLFKKKKDFHISKELLFIVYFMGGLCLLYLYPMLEEHLAIVNIGLYSYVQLSCLFWVDAIMEKEKPSLYLGVMSVIALFAFACLMYFQPSVLISTIIINLVFLVMILIGKKFFDIKADIYAFIAVGVYAIIAFLLPQILQTFEIPLIIIQGEITFQFTDIFLNQWFLFMNTIIIYLFFNQDSLKRISIFTVLLLALSFISINDLHLLYALMSLFILGMLYCIKNNLKIKSILFIAGAGLVIMYIIFMVFHKVIS